MAQAFRKSCLPCYSKACNLYAETASHDFVILSFFCFAHLCQMLKLRERPAARLQLINHFYACHLAPITQLSFLKLQTCTVLHQEQVLTALPAFDNTAIVVSDHCDSGTNKSVFCCMGQVHLTGLESIGQFKFSLKHSKVGMCHH